MDDWSNKILEFIYEVRSADNSPTPLNTFILEHFNISEDDMIGAQKVSGILNELHEKGLIEYIQHNKSNEKVSPLGYKLTTLPAGTLRNKWLEASLTLNGKQHVMEQLRIKRQDQLLEDQGRSTLETNRSIRRTNSIQIASVITTFLIILVGGIYQVLTYNLQKQQIEQNAVSNTTLETKIQSLTLRIDSLERKSQPAKNHIDSNSTKR